MKKILLLVFFSACCYSFLPAQLLVPTPAFPDENTAGLEIVMDATKGNQGLMNYANVNDVYVHIGVITNFSTNPTNWLHSVFTWPGTQTAAQCVSLGNNKWKYTIPTSLRTFFSVTDPNEHIQKIAILFRNGAGSQAQRNADQSDMYISVYNNANVAVRFTEPLLQPLYIPIPEPLTKAVGDNMSFTAIANKSSAMKLFLNGAEIQSANNVTTISGNSTLTLAGNNEIVAEANDGSTTKRDTVKFFVTPGLTIAPLPAGVRDGINYEPGDTSVTLVIYAPNKNRISVIGEFPGSNWAEQAQYLMNKTPDGNYWWLRVKGLTPQTEYAFQYLVDGTLKIADPYTEKVLDPNDAGISSTTYPGLRPYPTGFTSGIVSLVQTAAPQYTFQVPNFQRPDKRKLIIYELLLRDFIAAHDWTTLKDTLNYLQSLGVNAVEIMPFNEFQGNNGWGYNPDFYFAADKYYGPSFRLKSFIDSCHKRGIAVIMDIALNHSFEQSPLVQLYFDNATNRPASNNPWFNPVPKHAYNVGYDMNHESLATRYFVSRVVEHWLVNYKIDGFRFDLSKGFTQNQTCDANGGNCNEGAMAAYDLSRVNIWKRYYDSTQLKSPGSYVILEHFAANDEEIELSNYGMMLWGNSAYQFQQASRGSSNDWNFEWGLYTVRNWAQPHLVTYMESHDEERLMYRNLNEGASNGSLYNIKDPATALKRVEMCAAFLFNMPGPKMFWQFGEMGYDYSINTCTNTAQVADSCRLTPKPIRWDYLQNIQRLRLHDVYASLLKLRAHTLYKDVFISNQVQRSLGGPFKWMQVTTDTSKLLVVGNFDINPQAANVTFPVAGTWYDYLNGNTINATGAPQSISLEPGEYHVYLNRNVVNTVTTAIPNINLPGNGFSVKLLPNPVFSEAWIQMNIPETGNVRIELLNTTGQKVADIHSGFMVKGNNQVLFQKNNKLSSGVYLIKISTKNLTRTVNLVLQ